jgi:outer membrane protein TolC
LALENNLDIEIQRYGPRIAQADLLRAQAGGLLRGVSTNVQSGPSSAAVNQLTGNGAGSGTAAAAAATTSAAAGSGTVITSTGTNIPSLDETAFANYNWGHRTSPQSNSFTTGIPALVFRSNTFNAGVQKQFLTGTALQLGYSSQGLLSNVPRSEINPATTANFNFQFDQPLLRGFGIAVNNRNIRIAKNNLRVSDLVFKQQVITTVSTVSNLYADLVSFNEDVKVKRQALSLNEKLYSDNKKQVEIGTLAPIEIVRAEAEVARSQQDLTQSETNVLQQETILKNYLSRNGLMSPTISEARIIPIDRLRIPDVEAISPIQDLVAMAIAARPEIEQTRINVDNTKIQLLGSKSQLLPQFDIVASAQNNALAGQANTVPDPLAASLTSGILRTPANPAFLGGYGTILSQLFGRNYPDYSVGFSLNVPIRNRSAQADVIRDELTLRQQEIRQRQQVNQVRVDVQNALIGLQQARAAYQAAQKSRILQEQTLDAEQKKYALGASTIFFVIQAQRDLATAQAAEVSALTNYNRARVALDSATGQTLASNNISLDEALKGRVAKPPSPIPELDK